MLQKYFRFTIALDMDVTKERLDDIMLLLDL